MAQHTWHNTCESVSFVSQWQSTLENNLKGERFILVHSVIPWFGGAIGLGSIAQQNITACAAE